MDQSKTISVTEPQLEQMVEVLKKNPRDMLLSPNVRQYFALNRWQRSDQTTKIHQDVSAGVMPGTIAHNSKEIEEGIFRSTMRTLRLINPLSALEPVYGQAGILKALSIGPRTEMEIFHLIGVGFEVENITAIDLISSSPLIDAGDMHNMPYKANNFDVVISSWVLNYSSDPQRAVDEMIRVCKPGGFIAIGLTFSPEFIDGPAENTGEGSAIVGSMHKSADELKARFGTHIDRVCFQSDPDSLDRKGAVMLIVRKARAKN